jgi:hypothetical protein
MSPVEELTVESKVVLSEFADLFHIPADVLVTALKAFRSKLSKPYYSVSDCASRWCCSRPKAYAILNSSNAVGIDLRTDKVKHKKSKKVYSAESIARIEADRRVIADAT